MLGVEAGKGINGAGIRNVHIDAADGAGCIDIQVECAYGIVGTTVCCVIQFVNEFLHGVLIIFFAHIAVGNCDILDHGIVFRFL